jgi:LysR family glycine cleavage system transcriptional activator
VAGEVLSTPEQLAEARLIHVLSRATYWELAAEYLGVVLDVKRGLRTNVSGLALEMAENGLGCAVLPQWLVARAIADGRLISPLALNVPSPWAYYLALPEKAGRPQVRQLRDWLLAAGEKTGEEAGDGDNAAAGHERLA